MTRKLNIEKLKYNLARINKELPKRPRRQSVFWTPQLGENNTTKEYRVYALPWPDQSDDEDYPFKERWFYYNLGGFQDENGKWIKSPLTLRQFGEPDPVQEMIDQLMDSGEPEDKKLARLLFANQTAYMPVIVEGEEELGPRIWRFSSQFVYKRLSTLFLKYEKYGVLNDPENNCWLEVEVSPEPNKKPPLNKKVSRVDPDQGDPLSEDPEQIAKWLDSVPNLDDALSNCRYSYDEMQEMLEKWSETASGSDDEDGTELNEEKTEKDEKEDKPKAPKKKSSNKKSMSKKEALAQLQDFQDDDDDEDENEDDE